MAQVGTPVIAVEKKEEDEGYDRLAADLEDIGIRNSTSECSECRWSSH